MTQHPDLAAERTDYDSVRLLEAEAGDDPLALFDRWLEAAMAARAEDRVREPTGMTLSTIRTDADGRVWPSARIVLLKELDERGFVFYTNYTSAKGDQLATTDGAALTFWWPALFRQVRVEGTVEKVDAATSSAYFAVRPRGSQIGARASAQSHPCSSADELAEAYASEERAWQGRAVERPEHWGGYRLRPQRIEFWQGRPSRLHDRLLYERDSDGERGWRRTRLQP